MNEELMNSEYWPFVPVRYGDEGLPVYLAQLALRLLQFRGADGLPLKCDGTFGDNMLEAVNSFQRTEIAYGLVEVGTDGHPDGSFGTGCWKVLGVYV